MDLRWLLSHQFGVLVLTGRAESPNVYVEIEEIRDLLPRD
jgi:hypothetical protein